MIVDKKYIQNLREHSFLDISQQAENIILEQFGGEEIDVTFTEQDILEQVRKIISLYK